MFGLYFGLICLFSVAILGLLGGLLGGLLPGSKKDTL